MAQVRLLLAAVPLLCGTLLLSGCERLLGPSLDENMDYRLQVTSVALEPRRIWGLTIADFDDDGDDDFLVAGHGRKRLDRIFYYDDGSYHRSEVTLDKTADRHGCAAGDANGDGRPDIYCTSGAARGAGANANELWLAVTNGQYSKVSEPFGAEDASGRGRLATFLHADGDGRDDLYSTVWGERQDALPNQSRLYLNNGGVFAPGAVAWAGDWGGRCLARADLNADGIDELIVCAQREGAFMLHGAGDTARASAIPPADYWWLALATAPADTAQTRDIGALIFDTRGGSVQLFSAPDLLRQTPPQPRLRLPLRRIPGWSAVNCALVSLAINDATANGHNDLLITRSTRGSDKSACAGGPDLLLPGPDYRSYLALPASENGQQAQVYRANDHFLRVTAGEGWEGIIEVVRVVPRSQESGR